MASPRGGDSEDESDEEEEVAAFDEVTKMTDGAKSCEQFAVERGPLALFWSEPGAEERQGLPSFGPSLFEDASHGNF